MNYPHWPGGPLIDHSVRTSLLNTTPGRVGISQVEYENSNKRKQQTERGRKKKENNWFETAKHKKARSGAFLALCVCMCGYRKNISNSFQKMLTHSGHRFYCPISGLYLAIVFTDHEQLSKSTIPFTVSFPLLPARLSFCRSPTLCICVSPLVLFPLLLSVSSLRESPRELSPLSILARRPLRQKRSSRQSDVVPGCWR